MEQTGALYGFFCNISIDVVFARFLEKIQSLDYLHTQSQNNDEQVLFFYKDQAMLDYHLKHGYNTDLYNEGCFCVEAKQSPLKSMASLFEYDNRGRKQYYPMDYTINIPAVYFYRLVLPRETDESPFAMHIYTLFDSIVNPAEE